MLKHLIFCYILGGETPEKINGEFLDVKKSRKKSLWIITEKTFHHNWKHHHVLQQTAHRKKKKRSPKNDGGARQLKGHWCFHCPSSYIHPRPGVKRRWAWGKLGKCEVPPKRCFFSAVSTNTYGEELWNIWNITTMMSQFSFILLPLSVCSPLNCSWVCVFFSIPKASKVMVSRWTSLN